jgi:hypothetical protein
LCLSHPPQWACRCSFAWSTLGSGLGRPWGQHSWWHLFPLVVASAGDSAARPGSCRKTPCAL